MTVCPCCGHADTVRNAHPEPHLACPCCGHRWRAPDAGESRDYGRLAGRNAVPEWQSRRKFADRMASVRPLLKDGLRVLEVGCAEGGFGAEVKQQADVEYTGLEISLDADTARARLDHVLTRPTAELTQGGYDLLLSFHVLEHIADVGMEIGHWRRLLAPGGTIVVEVPNGSGHTLRDWDTHPEHLHFFSPTSLAALAGRAGLRLEALTSGHFESPIYADSLRMTVRPELDETEREQRLLDRYHKRLGGPFVIYGLGGDFRNCVLPILDRLPVAALADSDPARVGEPVAAGHAIQAYDPVRFAGLPVLVASLRFKEEIGRRLRELAEGPVRVVGLDDIYMEE